MRPSEELRYEPEVLRPKLALLEERLPSAQGAWGTVSRLTDSLASRLRSHTEKEEQLLATLATPHEDLPRGFLEGRLFPFLDRQEAEGVEFLGLA